MTDRVTKIVLRGDISDLQAKMVAAGKSVSSVGDHVTSVDKASVKFRQGLSSVGDVAGKMGLAAAAGLGLVTKAAMDWETAWAGVTKTVEGTPEQMAELEDGLRELARTLPATHDEIAGVAEAAGQLGIAREGVVEFTRTMIDLSETTNLTADEAATAIAQMANVMGTAPDDIDNLGSALVALGNDGASTEKQIILMAQRIAGAGAQIGLVESDILAIANATASMGVEVEAGGTAISQTFTQMAKAVAQGGGKLDSFAETAGMTGEAFAQAFGEDPAQAFAAFVGGLDRIKESGGDVFTTLDNVKLSGIRVSSTLLSMAASGDLLTDSLDLGATAWEQNSALAIEAAKRYETSAAQTQIAWNNIKDAAIEFGDVALPVLASAADKVSGFAQAVGGLPAPVKAATTGLLGVTAVLGGGLWFTSKALSGVADMRVALTNLGVSGDKAGKAMKGVGIAAGAMAGVGVAFAAIDALNKALDETLPGMETLIGQMLKLGEFQGATLGAEFDSLADSVDRITDGAATDGVQGFFDALLPGDNRAASLREASAEVAALDAALTTLVTSAGPEMATQMFRDLATAQGLTEGQMADLGNLLPGFREAIAGTANETDIAAGSTDAFAGAVGGSTAAVDANTSALEDNLKATKDRAKAAIGALDAESAYQEALDAGSEREKERAEIQERINDATNSGVKERADLQRQLAGAETPEERARIQDQITESLKRQRDTVADLREQLADYNKTLDLGTQAGRDNMDVVKGIAAGFNGMSDAQKNAKGAYREAREELIKQAMEYGATRKEAKKYADDLLELPPKVVTRLTLEKEKAEADLAAFKERFYGLKPKTVELFLKTTTSRQTGELGGEPTFARGGYTGDRGINDVAGVVHGREFVINAQATAMNRPLLEALNRGYPGYRDGGYVRPMQTQTTNYYSGGGTVSLSDQDINRLAHAMSNVRPLYGPVTVQGDNAFRRELQKDATRAASGGVNF